MYCQYPVIPKAPNSSLKYLGSSSPCVPHQKMPPYLLQDQGHFPGNLTSSRTRQLVLIVLHDQLLLASSAASPFSVQLLGLQMSWARVGPFCSPVLEDSGWWSENHSMACTLQPVSLIFLNLPNLPPREQHLRQVVSQDMSLPGLLCQGTILTMSCWSRIL